MTLPANWTLVPVTGNFAKIDGTPLQGRIYFTSAQVVTIGDMIVVPAIQSADLDANGSFTISLPATDDPDLNITGWAYTVIEPTGRAGYAIFVPYASGGIDLATVSPVVPPPQLVSTQGLRGLPGADGAGFVAGVATLPDTATPSAPATGSLHLYAKGLAGRLLLRAQNPLGHMPLQPALFQTVPVLINPGTGGTLTTLGCGVTSSGTITHPAASEAQGYMANFATAASAGGVAGTGNSTALWQRGTVAGQSNGFFYNTRVLFPDASYDRTGAGSTGSRFMAGFYTGALSTAVSSDNPAGSLACFLRRSVDAGAQDANWQFATKNGTTLTVADTGIAFVAGHMYDCWIYSPPVGDTVYWRIDDLTAGTTAEGATQATLPAGATALRAGVEICTVDAVSRNFRMQRVYLESDR